MGRLAHLRRTDDRGVTVVIVALALLVLVGSVGFAVDLGIVFNERRQEQSAVDAGALAAARDAFVLGADDDQIFDVVVDQTLANMDFPVPRTQWASAFRSCVDPGRSAAGYIRPLNTSSGVVDCISFTADRGAMRVLLPDTEVETAFASVLGVEGWEVNALAEVKLLPFSPNNNVIPFALSTASSQYASFQCIKVPPNGQSIGGPCPGTNQGNFNYLDISRPTQASHWSCTGNQDQRAMENLAAGVDHYLGTRSGTWTGGEHGGLGPYVEENCTNARISLSDPADEDLRPNHIFTVTGNSITDQCSRESSGLVAGMISSKARTDGRGGRLTRWPNTQTQPWSGYWRTRTWTCGGKAWANLDDTPMWWFMAPDVSAGSFVDGSPVGTNATVSYNGLGLYSYVAGLLPSYPPLGTTVEDVFALFPDQVASAQAVANLMGSTGSNQAPSTCDPAYIESAPTNRGITRTQAMVACINDYTLPREAYRLINGLDQLTSGDIAACSFCYKTDLFTRDSDGDGKFDIEYSPRFTWVPEMHQDFGSYLTGAGRPMSIKRFRALFVSTMYLNRSSGEYAGEWSVGDTPTNTNHVLSGFGGFIFDYEMLPQPVIDRAQQFPDDEPGFQLIR